MICFIILHYMAMGDTVACIKSIRALDGENRIIVVDNASPDGSGKLLRDQYGSDPDVDVLLNKKNLGFARGNNAGCDFAKDRYHPDFYVVLNNDIEVLQPDFSDRVFEIWKKHRFDVLGPDVYATNDRKHQSPKSMERTTIAGSKKLYRKYRGKVQSRWLVPLRCKLKQIGPVREIYRRLENRRDPIDHGKIHFDVPLHGSCLIFSARFMERREHAFFPGTLFYYETEILDYECGIAGYKTIYDPSIRVYHHQNSATKQRYADLLSRTRFMNREILRSVTAFLKAYTGEDAMEERTVKQTEAEEPVI